MTWLRIGFVSLSLAGFAIFAGFVACAVDVEALSNGQCPEGFKACDNQCVRTDSIDHSCAEPTCEKCKVPHARPVCSHTGKCTIATCDKGWTDCDGDYEGGPDTGCETETDFDVNNCGNCGRQCHGVDGDYSPACSGGACVVGECVAGRANCDEITSTGCEVFLATDNDHCGNCLTACDVDAGITCQQGECLPE